MVEHHVHSGLGGDAPKINWRDIDGRPDTSVSSVAHGSLAGTSGTQSITGLGFQPDLVLLSYYGQYVSGSIICNGFGNGTSYTTTESSVWMATNFDSGSLLSLRNEMHASNALYAKVEIDILGTSKISNASVTHQSDGFDLVWGNTELSAVGINYTAIKF